MKLNRYGVIAAAVAMAAALPMTAQASDGTITFTGTITAQTCTINGNGTGSKNFTVTLPKVSATALSATGQTAGATPFNIALTGCSPATGSVHTFFSGPLVDVATGNLTQTGTATNVEVGLLNLNYVPIVAGAADASQNSEVVALASGAATLNYYAQYVATGGASTAGTVASSVTYSIVYQ